MKLDFKPLDHAPSVRNAVVPISKHVQLSVSYGYGQWYVGAPGDYEAALQMIDSEKYPGIACLVYFKDNPYGNVWPHSNYRKLEQLIERGKQLKYAGAIEVFDVRVGATEKAWGPRFLCASGHDLLSKLGYTRGVWGKGAYRYIKAIDGEDEPAEVVSNGQDVVDTVPV